MQIAKQIPAFLLGAMFIFGGATHLFHFGPTPPPMTGDPATFMTLMGSTGYMTM